MKNKYSKQERKDLNEKKFNSIKTCKKCNSTGQQGKFFARCNIKGIWQYGDCKLCAQKITRAWRYNMNVDELDAILNKNPSCNICDKEFNSKHRQVIDHCHAKGHVRGILCDACNTVIGRLETNKSLISKYVKWIEEK